MVTENNQTSTVLNGAKFALDSFLIIVGVYISISADFAATSATKILPYPVLGVFCIGAGIASIASLIYKKYKK
jgi:hypothetical protein